MKTKTYNMEQEVIEFDDNNIEHVLAGPDYGQPWGNWGDKTEGPDWWHDECEFEEVPV